MKRPKIIDVQPTNGGRYYSGNTRYNGLAQRETLEATITNLSAVLGITKIERGRIERGNATIYNVGSGFMSASNTILLLSQRIHDAEAQRQREIRAEKVAAKLAPENL